jgi:hypothetical protein
MTILDDLKAAHDNLSADVQHSVAASKDFLAQQYQANLDHITACEEAIKSATANIDILKAHNESLIPFI